MHYIKHHNKRFYSKRFIVALFGLLVLSSLVFQACEEKIVAPAQEQSLEIRIRPRIAFSASAAAISRYVVTISAEGMESIIQELEWVDGLAVGRITDIPAGVDRMFVLEGFNEKGIALYRGVSFVDIIPGVEADVAIVLEPVAPLLRLTPFVDSLTLFGTVSLTLSIHNATAVSALDIQIAYPSNLVNATAQGALSLPAGAFVNLTGDVSAGLVGIISNPAGLIVDSLGNADLAILTFTRVSRSTTDDSVVIVPQIRGFLSVGNNPVPEIYTDNAMLRLPGAVLVGSQNQAPILNEISDTSIVVGSSLKLFVSAIDPDTTIPSLSASSLLNSSFVDNGDGTGVFDFSPDLSQIGLVEVMFFASDSSLSDTEIVSINVTNGNHSPVWEFVSNQAVAEGDTLFVDVGASDIDGDELELTPLALPINATFTDFGNGTGLVKFVPDFTQSGNHTIRLLVTEDSGLGGLVGASATDTLEIQITVGNVNLAPFWTAVFNQVVNEGGIMVMDVEASDPDSQDVGSLTMRALQLAPGSTFEFVDDSNSFVNFEPDFDQAGTYDFILEVSDGFLADTLNFQITVLNINRKPIINSIVSQIMNEGDSLTIAVTASDLDGDALALSLDSVNTRPPPNAVLVDNGDNTGSLIVTPGIGEAGFYTVRIVADDGNGGVGVFDFRLDVLAGNFPPILSAIGSQTFTEGMFQEISISANDPNGVTPNLSVINIPPGASFVDSKDGSGKFSWLPGFNQAGVYNVTFVADDGEFADREVVTITVDNVNRAPSLDSMVQKSVVVGDSLGFAVVATDPDGDGMVLSAVNLFNNTSFSDFGNGSGFMTFRPDASQIGLDSVLFRVSDGELTDESWALIEVTSNSCCDLPGDANNSGLVDVEDAVFLGELIFGETPPSNCPQEADVDGDGAVNVGDVAYLAELLFRQGPVPPACDLLQTYPDDLGIPDTIRIENREVIPGEHFSLVVSVFNDEPLLAGTIGFKWDDPDLILDSTSSIGSIVASLSEKQAGDVIDTVGRTVLSGFFIATELPIPPGTAIATTLWFTVSPTAQNKIVVIDSTKIGALGDFLLIGSGSKSHIKPQFVSGAVTIVAPSANQP